MSVQKIKAYICAVEAGSITLAAKQLNYTQSAISRMISDLEEDWGISLLTRNRSGVEISSDGLVILPILKTICKDYSELDYAISEIHGVQSGIIRVGSFSSIATGWLPLMIKAFNTKYPKIDFELVNGEYFQIIEWIRNGKVDCGFIRIPTSKNLDAVSLFKDSLVAVLPKDHPLINQKFYPIKNLANERFIGLKEERDHEINGFLETLNEKPIVHFAVSNDYAILSMVECGLGMSIVHDLILHPNRYDIVSKPFNPPYYREIAIATKKDTVPSTVTKLFIEHAKAWSESFNSKR